MYINQGQSTLFGSAAPGDGNATCGLLLSNIKKILQRRERDKEGTDEFSQSQSTFNRLLQRTKELKYYLTWYKKGPESYMELQSEEGSLYLHVHIDKLQV